MVVSSKWRRAPSAAPTLFLKHTVLNYSMIEVKYMVMIYRITSDERQMFRRPEMHILAKLETIFYARYLQAVKTGDGEAKRKNLMYFNHVFELRNRLEFGIETE
jgi:hypothetical protein